MNATNVRSNTLLSGPPGRLPWSAILHCLDVFEGAGFQMADADASGRAATFLNKAAFSYAGMHATEATPIRQPMMRELAETYDAWMAEGHEDAVNHPELIRRMNEVLRRRCGQSAEGR